MDRLGRERAATHRHQDAARKHRIYEGEGIACESVAVARDPPRIKGIVRGCKQWPNELGLCHSIDSAGARRQRPREDSVEVVRPRLEIGRSPTTPTLMIPSGSGIIHNQPCSKRCTVIMPASSPLRRSTLRKWPYTAAVVELISPLQAEVAGEQRIATGGYHMPGQSGRYGRVGPDRGDSRAISDVDPMSRALVASNMVARRRRLLSSNSLSNSARCTW
jgi:hypothetical protein